MEEQGSQGQYRWERKPNIKRTPSPWNTQLSPEEKTDALREQLPLEFYASTYLEIM